MASDSTSVRPGMLPPIISTTPNSPTVWAKPSTAPVMKPGRASGTATVQKASEGVARNVKRPLPDGFESVANRLHDERHGVEHRADDQRLERERQGAQPKQPADQ